MKIVKYPHPILAYQSKPLRKIDQELRDIVAEMFDLMYESQGVGLAGNQVELPYQLFVMNPTGDPEKKEEYVMINPVILKKKGREEGEEGCLSFPDLHVQIPRATEITCQAISLDGTLRQYHLKGFMARIVQHETDHLHGHCFYERANVSSQGEIRDALEELSMIYESDSKRGFNPTEEELRVKIRQLEEART